MAIKRIADAALIPHYYESISLSNSTAVGLNSTGRQSHIVLFSVETQDVRMRNDGTDPTLNTGVVYKKDLAPYWLSFNGTAALKFQRTTGTANISVVGFTYED